MNMLSNLCLDICMLNSILMRVKFGENWSLVPSVIPAFILSPKISIGFY